MMIAVVWQDVRYAIRSFGRAPAFVLLAVATIATGVGATTAIFSVVDAVLLRPLPFARPHELFVISDINRKTGASSGSAAPANFLDWRARQHAFTGLAAYRSDSVTVIAGDRPERRRAAMVTANFFDVLGVTAALGRTFVPGDDAHGATRVAILGDTLWRDYFGGAPDIVGRTVRFEDEPYTIVGVMPKGVEFPDRAQLWITPHWPVPDDPLLSPGDDPSPQRTHNYFFVVGRTKPGVRFEGAAADMSAVAASIERDNPSTNQDMGASLVPLREDLIVADVRSTTLVLFAAVALLLLIATANVSGLLMARAAGRCQEIAIRAALGASRGRIVAQLLTESILLALVGGAGGVLIALWLVPAIVTLSPTDLTIAGPVTINRGVLAFGLIASTASGVLFGLAPARQLSRADINEELKQAGRGASGNQRRLRAAIVGAEVALSLVLLVAAGLTVRSFLRLQQVPIGFDPERVMTFRLAPSATRYRTVTQRADFWEKTLTAVSHVPDLESAAVVSRLPLLAGNSSRGIVVPGLPADVQPVVDYRTSSPGYFRIMGIPLLRGRDFTEADRDGRPLVAILTKLTADRYWPGRDPIGRTFKINDPGPDYTIVGIVGDIRAFSLDEAPRPMIYVPYRQDPFFSMAFVMRPSGARADAGARADTGARGFSRATATSDAVAALQPSIRAAIWSVDKEQAVGALQSMDDQISNSLARRRFSVTLLTGFGGVAVMLAAVGLYGVLAFIVSQRRREIGVRIALGATARDVIVGVLGEGMRLAGIGMICGLVLSLAVTRVMSSLLFGTSPTDVVAFASAATLLTAIAIVASAVPALRASRVDPLVALRDE